MTAFFQTLNNRTMRTFRPKPTASRHSILLQQYAQATLGTGPLRMAVKLPEGEDQTEWIALHVVDFYNQINMLYGTITEFCSPAACPHMMATKDFEYLWQDPNSAQYKRPTKVCAPEYVENLFNWCQQYLDSQDYFPTKIGVPFAKSSISVYKTMLKRLFRVYAHIYCHHFEQITELGLQPHLNTSLKHFVLFTSQFDLIESKELGPLQELVELMKVDEESSN